MLRETEGGGYVYTGPKDDVIPTYAHANDHPLHPWGDGREDPTWEVIYDPNKKRRELGKGEGRHRYVDTLNNVTMKIRGRQLVKGDGKQERGDCICTEALEAEIEIAGFACVALLSEQEKIRDYTDQLSSPAAFCSLSASQKRSS